MKVERKRRPRTEFWSMPMLRGSENEERIIRKIKKEQSVVPEYH